MKPEFRYIHNWLLSKRVLDRNHTWKRNSIHLYFLLENLQKLASMVVMDGTFFLS